MQSLVLLSALYRSRQNFALSQRTINNADGKRQNFDSQARKVIVRIYIKPHESGPDVVHEQIFYDACSVSVSWEHLEMENANYYSSFQQLIKHLRNVGMDDKQVTFYLNIN